MKTPGDSAPQVDYISSASDLKVGEVALPPHLAMARTSISNDYQTPPTAGGMHTAALGGHSSAFPFPACKLAYSISVLRAKADCYRLSATQSNLCPRRALRSYLRTQIRVPIRVPCLVKLPAVPLPNTRNPAPSSLSQYPWQPTATAMLLLHPRRLPRRLTSQSPNGKTRFPAEARRLRFKRLSPSVQALSSRLCWAISARRNHSSIGCSMATTTRRGKPPNRNPVRDTGRPMAFTSICHGKRACRTAQIFPALACAIQTRPLERPDRDPLMRTATRVPARPVGIPV